MKNDYCVLFKSLKFTEYVFDIPKILSRFIKQVFAAASQHKNKHLPELTGRNCSRTVTNMVKSASLLQHPKEKDDLLYRPTFKNQRARQTVRYIH